MKNPLRGGVKQGRCLYLTLGYGWANISGDYIGRYGWRLNIKGTGK